jgi:hypothetical protein
MAPEIDGRVLVNDVAPPAEPDGELDLAAIPPGTLAWVEVTEAHANDLVGRLVATL